jgi:glutamate dehydrogenase
MTEDVATLVLRDNYLQGEALSVAEARGPAALARQARLIRELERRGRLDRALEYLPDDETLAERAAQHRGLVRPELAVLLAYAKLALDAELLDSDLPDAPELAEVARHYFPAPLRAKLAAEIDRHPLRREIIATVVTNDIVNRGGITFITDLQARTARPSAEIARAYLIVRRVFELPALWAEIEALDGKVAAPLQSEMLLDITDLIEHAAGWLLRAKRIDIGEATALFAPAVGSLGEIVAELLPPAERDLFEARTARFADAGVPESLAGRISRIIFLTSALEVGDLAARTRQPIERAAQTFYGVGARFALDELRAAARRLPAETSWQKAAAETVIDDSYGLQADLSARVLDEAGKGADPLASWIGSQGAALVPVEAIAAELRAAQMPDLAMLVVALRQLRQATG